MVTIIIALCAVSYAMGLIIGRNWDRYTTE